MERDSVENPESDGLQSYLNSVEEDNWKNIVQDNGEILF